MRDFFEKFKIPTVVGLALIIVSMGAGVFMVSKEQIFVSNASPNVSPQNIILTNLSDNSATISYQTSISASSFITYGQDSPSDVTILDDRDTKTPLAHSIHYFTLKNLLPKTTYQYKIISGKNSSQVSKFTTLTPLSNQTISNPIIGSALDSEEALDEGVVYLSIADATTQSSLVKSAGNFLIPLSQIRKIDSSEGLEVTEDTVGKLTIISAKGQATALFKLGHFDKGLPPIKIGQDLDLMNYTPPPTPNTLIQDLSKYDLNGDGIINTTDYAVVLQNFGNPSTSSGLKNKKADLNGDGVVDQKDVDLMSQRLKSLGS